MKKIGEFLIRIIYTLVICFAANSYLILKNSHSLSLVLMAVSLFLFVNILPSFATLNLKSVRLRTCGNGCELLCLFLASTIITIIMHIVMGIVNPDLFQVLSSWLDWLFHILIIVAIESVVFWNGIIRVYVSSAQLGLKWRVIGIICGWIPVANLIVLGKIIGLASTEVKLENEKILLNQTRKEERICATKYPILMVHGVFFRDSRYLNYWGRIPKELELNGATIYYGNHQSAASVADCGQEILNRMKEIVAETGCEKVNIIAHSKGGLDCRYAISALGGAEYVASLTTINTPHRGCEFADCLLGKIPKKQKEGIAATYNTTLKKLGDPNPDFLAAVNDLTASACYLLNEKVKNVSEVYYQSVGSKMNVALGGRFPLNLTNKFVECFDGCNDGLVGENSFPWGSNYTYLTVKGRRGISHGDMIDLNRENIEEFDVREFYVQLVHDLKKKGF